MVPSFPSLRSRVRTPSTALKDPAQGELFAAPASFDRQVMTRAEWERRYAGQLGIFTCLPVDATRVVDTTNCSWCAGRNFICSACASALDEARAQNLSKAAVHPMADVAFERQPERGSV